MTLMNGEQAEAAVKAFHQSRLRERELSVQLQPTDALLCVAKLPPSLTQAQCEELVRPFGILELCFLVYREHTGHSKGYGFAEYMKKDSAARAKSDLLGKPLGPRTLYVHRTDVGQLPPALLHSRASVWTTCHLASVMWTPCARHCQLSICSASVSCHVARMGS